MSEAAEMQWQSAALTDPGKRRKHNEDAVLALPDKQLWMVADGLGGHEAGDVASALVRDNVARIEREAVFPEFIDKLEDLLRALNRKLRIEARKRFNGRTMGCTVVTLAIQDRLGVSLWAGDSRLYRMRAGRMTQITRDHSPAEEMVERGMMTPEQAAQEPETSVITRAIGGQEHLHVDIALFDVEPEDTFLLCSDGLYREVVDDEIAAAMCAPVLPDAAESLLALTLERGARDNVSIVACRVPS